MVSPPGTETTVRGGGGTADRRRGLVRRLEGLETPVTVDELADELGASGRTPDRSRADDEVWGDRHELLHEVDLPALDRAGLLTFDADRGLVARTPEELPGGAPPGTAVRPRAVDGEASRIEWSRLFLGLALLSAVVLGATAAGLGPLAGVSTGQVSTALVVLFSALSVLVAVRR